VGFCGGLTTFSTWMVESMLLTRDGHSPNAAAYLVATLLAGLLAVVTGVFATRAVLGRRTPIVFDPADDD
jgi:CrcB protein